MRKKVSLLLVLLLLLTVILPVPAQAYNHDITVIVDGKTLSDKGYGKQGRTMVPLRAISEAFGFEVMWAGNDAVHPIQIYPKVPGVEIKGVANDFGHFAMKPGNKKLVFFVRKMQSDGSRVATGEINSAVAMDRYGDVAPEVINGRTYVPIRLIAETFGCQVDWHNPTRTVTIGKCDPEVIMSFANGWTGGSKINRHWQQDLIVHDISFSERNGLLTISAYNRALNARQANMNVPVKITVNGKDYMTKEWAVFNDHSSGSGTNPIVVPVRKGETVQVKATVDPNQDFFDVDRSNNTITRTYTVKGR